MSVVSNRSFGSNNWCLQFETLSDSSADQSGNYLLTSLSNGECHVLNKETLASVNVCKGWFSGKPISGMTSMKDGNTFALSSDKTIKIFDLRTDLQKNCATTITSMNAPIMSLTYDHNTLCYGTELKGVDAPIHLYRKGYYNTPYRSFLDSHHDDVMSLKFHPTDKHVLLSGSTDGYCNIYDLTQEEEEDALHQVINYQSVHSCGFLSPKRIFVLGHMECLSVHSLNDKSDELNEEKPLDFGDLREPLNCEYVVNVYPGFVATGKNSKSSLKIWSLQNEQINTKQPIVELANVHGGEIIRDVFVQDDLVYTCGEDGQVNISKTPNSLHLPKSFWEYNTNNSAETNVFEGTTAEVDMSENADEQPDSEANILEADLNADKPRSSKHKSKGKSKHKSKHKSANHSSSSSRLYKPY
ncbi:hypothetical protein ACO0RG_001221 [Hanseniaspora osmophila]